MGNIFFTSDLHFGHAMVAGLRGFHDPADHDAWIQTVWRAQVKDDDTVWVLGDLTANDRHVPAMLDTIASLPGTKHLIAGNHDPVHPMRSNAVKWFKTYLTAFDTIAPFGVKKIAGQRVKMSHFPFGGTDGSDHTDADRFDDFRLKTVSDQWLLHGHTHLAHQVFHGGNQIHVGWDAHHRLVPLSAIDKIINGNPIGGVTS